jgi:hypothetical protein
MKIISIYSYKTRFAIVSSQELIGGLNISQNKFLVSDEQPDLKQF